MQITLLSMPEVILLQPQVFEDERGFFFESFNQQQFNAAIGKTVKFVQDNHSYSVKNVLRGLHYQIQQPQGKLIRALSGTVFDVAVDMRPHSSTFGRYVTAILSGDKHNQLWIPEGFAHGFIVLSETANIMYKTTTYWAPQYERCIAWNSPVLNIPWPIQDTPILSKKDQQGIAFSYALNSQTE
ncbi:MAG: dTDP-4-dehydrorhamnose 3,5-epimerase [Legionellaceae bacterium]|nr:dTDP-4-dehydrorhamnose 3,5-epimerase [Legionellaceae bacterium]MBP9774352.1 dTDP-4-dehydrorhamnose 3,5-epimerase [Legionellaceae bacterium]